MRPHSFILYLLVCYFFVGACGGGGPSGRRYSIEATPAMVQEYRRAENNYQRGRYTQALTLFNTYIDKHPYNRLTDQSRIRIGKIYLKIGKPREALRPLNEAVRGVYDTELTPEALYYKMIAYDRLGESQKTWRVLRQVRWSATRARHRILLASLGVKVGKQSGRSTEDLLPLYLEVLDAYVILSKSLRSQASWILSEANARRWVKRWVEASGGNRKYLKRLAKRFVGKSSGGYVLYKLAKLAYEEGKAEEARNYFDQYVRSYPKHEYVSKGRIALGELGKKVDTGYLPVGVILPLSGRYGSYGKAVLRGIECSAGVYRPCRSELPIRLIIRDSAGDPEKATAAFQELMATEYIMGAVGPLAQVEVGAVASQADQHQVPIITLTQKKGIAEISPYVFRNFLTIEDQVQTLARHICDGNLREIAILYPDTSLGKTYREIFTTEIARCEGTIKAAASYNPEAGNFQDAIRNLKFSIRKHKLGAELGFEALFIPDSYKNLSKIIPLLSFHNVRGVQLLGTAGWNNSKLVREHPEVMEGALFVGGFFSASGASPTRRFTQDFQHAFGSTPSFLEAYGYDSMELLQHALKVKRKASRRELRDALSRIDHFPGATGAITFDRFGDAKRRLVVLTVKEGEIREFE